MAVGCSTFLYPPDFKNLLVPKGSVAIDGVSLTVIEPTILAFFGGHYTLYLPTH